MDNSDDDSDGPERDYNYGDDVYLFGLEKLLQYHACCEALCKTLGPGPGSPRAMELIISTRNTMGEFSRLCRVRAGLYTASASKCQWVVMNDQLGASTSTAGCRSLHIFILPVLPRL